MRAADRLAHLAPNLGAQPHRVESVHRIALGCDSQRRQGQQRQHRTERCEHLHDVSRVP
jgi:hypothetical protein